MGAAANPIRRYKLAKRLTYSALASQLGISESYAKKLGTGQVVGVSDPLADQFERRTRRGITYAALMRWRRARLHAKRRREK